MKEKVTVIVPIYNVEQYLPTCLDSIISQTLKDIKIICVNDGSTDNSAEILESYREKDNRISIVTKKNGGLSSARNAGLKKCDTEYVMFCDSDDYYDSTMCEKMLSAIERDNSDIAACSQNVIYHAHEEMRESDTNYYRLKYSGLKYIDDELILKTDVSVVNKIFRMSIIKKYKLQFPDGLNNEDFYFYNAYMSVSELISFVNQRLYNYVRHSESIMSENFDAEKLSMDHLLVAEKLFDFYKETGFLEKHKNLFWKQWTLGFWFAVEHSSKKHKNEIFVRAKEFANKNFEKWVPDDKKIAVEVKHILTDNKIKKAKRWLRRGAVGAYKRINIGYRRRNQVNSKLETMAMKNNELMDRLENIKGEVNVKRSKNG